MKAKEYTEIQRKYCDKFVSLLQKSAVSETGEAYLGNTEIINELYDMVCEYHHIDHNETTDEGKLQIIDEYLDENRIRSMAWDLTSKMEQTDYYGMKLCNPEVKESMVEKIENLTSHFTGSETMNYLGILKGFRQEIQTGSTIRALLPQKDYKIWTGYRHTNKADVLAKSTEHDLLILCRKGLFTIEIKSFSHNRVAIQTSGTMQCDRRLLDKSPSEQCIQHKMYLQQMLDGDNMKSHIFALLYLENCSRIDNHFSQIEAYNSIAILTNSIITRPDVYTEQEVAEIESVLNKNDIGELKLKYKTYNVNLYAVLCNFAEETERLLYEKAQELKDEYDRNKMKSQKREMIKNAIMLFAIIILVLSSGIYFGILPMIKPYMSIWLRLIMFIVVIAVTFFSILSVLAKTDFVYLAGFLFCVLVALNVVVACLLRKAFGL